MPTGHEEIVLQNQLQKAYSEKTTRDDGLALLILFLQLLEDQLSALIGFLDYSTSCSSHGGGRKEEGTVRACRERLFWNEASIGVSVTGLLIDDDLLKEVCWGGLPPSVIPYKRVK